MEKNKRQPEMSGSTIEIIQNPNANAAAHEGSTAAEYANNGRKYRTEYYFQQKIVGRWNDLLSNDPVFLFTIIFIICFAADILITWEMYRDVVSYILTSTPAWAMLLLGFLINGFAAVVSHYFSKTKSDGLFNYEVWNLQHIIHKGEKPHEIAVRDVTKDKKNDFFLFLLTSVILVVIVGFISFNRSFLLTAGGNKDADYNLLQKILPIVIVVAEVFTGIYLVFVLKRLLWNYKASSNRGKFLNFLHLTNEHDKIVGRLIQKANENNEYVDFQRNVKNSLFRIKYRDLNDSYIDEVEFNQAEFIIKGSSDLAIPNLSIVGNLNGGGQTNATYTDEQGKAEVHWNSKDEDIDSLIVNGIKLMGPFTRNFVHVVRLEVPSIHHLQ
jgi:hypothetical protein